MNKQTNWTKNILTWGLVLMGLGLVVAIAGFFLPSLGSSIVLPDGLVIGISIMLFVLGIAGLAQYAYVRMNPKAGHRMMIDEQDERTKLVHARAGQRAYWISSSLAFLVLIWVSFAGDVGLPTLSGSALYFSMVAVVVVPFIVYIAGIVYEQSNQ